MRKADLIIALIIAALFVGFQRVGEILAASSNPHPSV
jgi:hypothetical protein